MAQTLCMVHSTCAADFRVFRGSHTVLDIIQSVQLFPLLSHEEMRQKAQTMLSNIDLEGQKDGWVNFEDRDDLLMVSFKDL